MIRNSSTYSTTMSALLLLPFQFVLNHSHYCKLNDFKTGQTLTLYTWTNYFTISLVTAIKY